MRFRLAQTLGFAAAVALVSGVAACNSSAKSDSTAQNECGLEIAFFGALTGPAANLGVNIRDGAQLAVDQYNAAHADCTVTLKSVDSEGDPAKAPGLARSLVTDKKLVGVVGPAFSGESEAADPIFDESGIPVITPSATRTSLSTKNWKVFHRAVANDDSQGPAAGRYIKNVLKPTKVFVVDDQSAYGAGLADAVKKELSGLVVDNSSQFLRGDRGFGGIPHPAGRYADDTPIFGVRDATPYFWLALTVVILVVVAARNLERSRVGRSWLAIRVDEEAAQVMAADERSSPAWQGRSARADRNSA